METTYQRANAILDRYESRQELEQKLADLRAQRTLLADSLHNQHRLDLICALRVLSDAAERAWYEMRRNDGVLIDVSMQADSVRNSFAAHVEQEQAIANIDAEIEDLQRTLDDAALWQGVQ